MFPNLLSTTITVSPLPSQDLPIKHRSLAAARSDVMEKEKTHEVVQVIDAPVSEVWAIISAFGSERLWFPGVIKSNLDGFGIGAVRTLTFDSGTVVHERLEVADPETHTIRYLILDGVPNTTNPRGTLRLTGIEGDKTEFSWTGSSDWTDPSFKPVLAGILDEMFKGCMDAVAQKLT